MIRRPPRATRTDTLFPYTTLFRSLREAAGDPHLGGVADIERPHRTQGRCRHVTDRVLDRLADPADRAGDEGARETRAGARYHLARQPLLDRKSTRLNSSH